jgi:hypothetical protein
MSNSSNATGVPRGSQPNVPRAIIHKKVLDAAESNPNASMEQLAEQISGASLSIVERVLAEYGDPAAPDDENGENLEKETDDASTELESDLTIHQQSIGIDVGSKQGPFEAIADGDGSKTDTNTGEEMRPEPETRKEDGIDEENGEPPVLSPSDLTEKQLETMQVIATRPDATQVELGERLGVTSATINQRINAIDGFQWSKRHEFVDDLFEETPVVEMEEASNETDSASAADSVDIPIETQLESGRSADAAVRDSREALVRLQHDGGENSPERSNSETDADRSCVDEELARATTDSLEELTDRLIDLSRRIETLERRSEGLQPGSVPARADPELTHKIVHACLNADNISESEELQILKTILPSETTDQ